MTGVLAVAAAVVPCVFWTGTEAVFSGPKLVALWGLLAVAFAAAAAAATIPRVTPVDAAVAVFLVLNVVAWSLSTDRTQSLYGERLQYQGLLALLAYVGF